MKNDVRGLIRLFWRPLLWPPRWFLAASLVATTVAATAWAEDPTGPPVAPPDIAERLRQDLIRNGPRKPSPEQEAAMAVQHRALAPAVIDGARSRFPYVLRLPETIPPGASLFHAMAGVDYAPDGTAVHSLDVFYELKSGAKLHIWQTDGRLSEKDPVNDSRGVPVSGSDGQLWMASATAFQGVVSYSTRYADGITLSVDFPVDALDAQQVLDSIR